MGQTDAVRSCDGDPMLFQSAYVFWQKIIADEQVQALVGQKSDKHNKNTRNFLCILQRA